MPDNLKHIEDEEIIKVVACVLLLLLISILVSYTSFKLGQISETDRLSIPDRKLLTEIKEAIDIEQPFILDGYKFYPLGKNKHYAVCQKESIWKNVKKL